MMQEENPNLAFGHPSAPKRAGTCNMDKLQGILERFEITVAEANDLVLLHDYQMVIIADDSGSMNMAAAPPHLRVLGQPIITRWHELKQTVGEIVEIASCFDESGVDVFFLNRQPVLAVKDAQQPNFLNAFATPASGGTPLTETLQRVAARVGGERKTLLFILTDGEPTGGRDLFIRRVSQVVATGKIRIQIMACTADDDEIGWLNDLDHKFHEVDVTDDYFSEKQEVIQAGIAPRFTRGDWCMKAMLGPVSRKFDQWDEKLGKKSVPMIPGCGGDCAVM